jgi:hypothetical protein
MQAHGGIEGLFSRMTERRMAKVVYEREGLGQVCIQSKLCGNGARNLRDLDGMSEAVAEMVRVAAREDLRLCLQAAKGPRVDDAITVALEVVAVRMGGLGITASARLFDVDSVVGEMGLS